MQLLSHSVYKFDDILPMYNWIYPLSGSPPVTIDLQGAGKYYRKRSVSQAQGRALYFHIPFCETICTFCPFVRGKYSHEDLIESYVQALITEIQVRTQEPAVRTVPIRAIYFGGGTPSLLSAKQMLRIGRVIKDNFDLSRLQEFSFEFEAKSVTEDRISALLEIGVTHARFGLQTLSTRFRRLFNLTATVDHIMFAAERLSTSFPYTSCDVLYGMNGQTEDDLEADVEQIAALGLRNLDFYPINNVVTQPRLHDGYRAEGLQPTSGLTKHYMNRYVRSALKLKGYLPHNGHGYVRVSDSELQRNPVVTSEYSFVYHEHVYGYAGYDLLGFGNSAISSFSGFTTVNTASRTNYTRELLATRSVSMSLREHSEAVDACRPLALRLPYHADVEKANIDWSMVPPESVVALEQCIAEGLVVDDGSTMKLSSEGWHWYSNLMFYLMPKTEKVPLLRAVQRARTDEKRDIEMSGLPPTTDAEAFLSLTPE